MDERVVLKNGKKYEFDYDGESFSYEISKCIGRGGNSIVYEVLCNEYERGRLKEFYPSDLCIERKGDDSLIVSEDDLENFDERKDQFEHILSKRAALIEMNLDIAKTMPEFCQLVSARNTSYIFQSYTNGRCYADVSGESLEDIVKTTIGLVKALKCYHDIGYVHLDIKPENMLVIKEGKDIRVQLFDYETATPISDLKCGKVKCLPYTEMYSAPEQINREYEKIDVVTDVFSVGILLFEKIMGRFPDKRNRELAHNKSYDYDIESYLFKDIPLIIQKYLDTLFEHTIRISEKLRYNDDDKFIETLEEILSFTKKKNQITQRDNYYSDIQEFFGRIEELRLIGECLDGKNIVLLHGMGGIGKSELVKKYLSENEDKYTKIIYIEETGNSIRDVVNNDENICIEGLKHYEGISAEEYFDNKVEILRDECAASKEQKKNVIIVFDNTEFFADLTYLNKLKRIGCKIIIVSRDPWVGVPFECKVEVSRIGNRDEEVALFLSHMDTVCLDEKEISAVEKIINHYDGHPLILKLIAVSISQSGKLPDEMLREIEKKGISSSGDEEIRFIEDGHVRQERIEDIAYNLFDSYDLCDAEKNSLQFMSLLSADGIEKNEARKFLGDLKAVNSLIGKGFIRSAKGMFSIHPIIKEMIENRYPPCEEKLREYSKIVYDNISASQRYGSLSYKQVILYASIGAKIDSLVNLNDAEYYTELANAYQRVGQGEKANEYYLKSLNILTETYGRDDERVAMAYMRYGRILGINGDYTKSKACLVKSVEYYNTILPVTGAIVGTAIGTLIGFPLLSGATLVGGLFAGGLASTIKKKAQSERLDSKKSALECQTNGINYEQRLNAAKVYNQLAIWYCDQGDCKSAFKLCKEAYDTAEEQAEINDRAKKHLYYFADTMGNIQYESAEYGEALLYYKEALKLKQEYYSDETVYFLHSYLGIAKCKYMLGENEEALEYVLKAMDISERMKGLESIDTAKIYHVAANIYQQLGRNKEAMMYFDQSKQLKEKILGKRNGFTLLVTIDYLLYRIQNQGLSVSKDEYDDLIERINSKERPRTASFKRMYDNLNLIAEKFGFEKI